MSHILIVDDSIVIRKVLCRIFDGLNFKAHQADTREHAFDICTKYAPDIIIIDWLIPSDGAVSLVRALRKLPQCAHTRFFVCSALFTSEDMRKIKEADIEDIVLKPFDRHHIWEKFASMRPAA